MARIQQGPLGTPAHAAAFHQLPVLLPETDTETPGQGRHL